MQRQICRLPGAVGARSLSTIALEPRYDWLYTEVKSAWKAKLFKNLGIRVPKLSRLSPSSGEFGFVSPSQQSVGILSTPWPEVDRRSHNDPIFSLFDTPNVDVTDLRFLSNKTKAAFDIVCVDARHVRNDKDIEELFHQLRANVKRVSRNGRIVFLLHAPDRTNSTTFIAAHDASTVAGYTSGITSLMKSLAKEVGGNGIAVNALAVPSSMSKILDSSNPDTLISEQVVYESGSYRPLRSFNGVCAGISTPLHYLCSPLSSYITGQVIPLSMSSYTDDTAVPPYTAFHKPLRDQVAVVTGATGGIGSAVVEVLSALGATCVCVDVPERTDEVCALASRVNGVAMLLDFMEEDAGRIAAERLAEKYVRMS